MQNRRRVAPVIPTASLLQADRAAPLRAAAN